ncbi:hypothetical protein TEA_000748 [Camellia sinensis var. sinensis]|uniref:Uncharacterized protein n=1 Tax=Camellia sinensis var. sinensis TaxID=542762 RepID=A0A4S4EE47_CAMSN|nr:hypothetical protein TEA_000748 [Camellia sinensis var. sinensis]
MGIAGILSPDQLHCFQSQGFLVLESFASPEEVDAMRNRMDQLLDDFDCLSTASIFSTKNQVSIQNLTPYLTQGFGRVDEAWDLGVCSLQEKAFDEDGNLKQPKQLSINKVGHGMWGILFFFFVLGSLHEIDPVFKKFSCSEKLSSLLLSLDYKRPVIIQSMYIFKAELELELVLVSLTYSTVRAQCGLV